MLKKLNNERLHWFIDPDGEQLRQGEKGLRYVLSSDVPVFTLLAYWRAKASNIPIEVKPND